MRKILIMLVVLFSVVVLMGCGNKGSKTTTQLNTDNYWDQDQNGTPDWQEEEVTLKFATWAHTSPDVVTMTSVLLDGFMEKYPNIHVEIDIVSENYQTWDQDLLLRLETGTLPDVFLVGRAANLISTGTLYDISTMYENDSDTEFIFDSVKNVGVYGESRYFMPTFFYPQIWFVNLDILSEKGITKPPYNWTYDQMESIALGATDEMKHYIGQYGCEQYFSELPKVLKGLDSNWYAYGFDGTRFNYDDPVFQAAATRLENAIASGSTYGIYGISEEQKLAWYGDPEIDPRYAGKVAIWRQPSWEAKDHFAEMDSFNWDAYPGPGGVTGGNIDIMAIAATTDHPQAAYQLMKWMTFGEDGLIYRYQNFSTELFISGNNYEYPIVDYGIDKNGVNQIWDNIPYGDTAEGLVSPEFIESLKQGAIFANKSFIGWDEANSATWDYFYQIQTGESNFATLKDVIVEDANRAYTSAREGAGLE